MCQPGRSVVVSSAQPPAGVGCLAHLTIEEFPSPLHVAAILLLFETSLRVSTTMCPCLLSTERTSCDAVSCTTERIPRVRPIVPSNDRRWQPRDSAERRAGGFAGIAPRRMLHAGKRRGDPAKYLAMEERCCALCGRATPRLTRHHLVPRTLHKRNRTRRKVQSRRTP